MPTHELAVPDDTPLFPEDDPLTLTIAGVPGKFLCKDRYNPPIESRSVDPTRQPVSWFIETLTRNVVDDRQDEFRRLVEDAVETETLLMDEMRRTLEWLGEQREAAEKGTLARVVKRPTKARPRSTRS